MSGYCEQCGNTLCICDDVANKGSLIKRAEEAFESAKKREWQGLTEDELEELERSAVDRKWGHINAQLLSRAIEAKLKEKNT